MRGRSRGDRRRKGGGFALARREQHQRVHVPARVIRPPDPELHVRLLAGRRLTDGPDRLTLRDSVADRYDD